jgi:hypothetical protein
LKNLAVLAGKGQGWIKTYRIHVTKVAGIYKTTRLDERNLLVGADRVRCQDVGQRVALGNDGAVCGDNAIGCRLRLDLGLR